jgi:8-oxo-dGTP diphosphatase
MKQKQGTGILFYDVENDRVLVFQRDNIEDIPFPGMLDIIGGAVEEGETPAQTIEREVFEELFDLRIGAGYRLTDYAEFTVFVDSLGIEEHIFVQPIDFSIENIQLLEGECLAWIGRADVSGLRMAYGYEAVVREFFTRPEMMVNRSV